MLAIKTIRENFETVKEKLQTRGVAEETLTEFLQLDKERRRLLVESEEKKNIETTYRKTSPKPNVTKKIPQNRSLKCVKLEVKLKNWIKKLQRLMKN
ncbi:seryl-tRNA synthetase [Tetragenococcus muriaticus PMC-11-5]|uniref:Seryl-tRNA synthetase n=1 Tax=Tetragenococcus muriaticus PMC-11-5 TaxID=1302649 RepID=A0A091BX74_9ENTE|nr:seryl-tRNA synthetase [Tetragenococcus muriaticus PMC-11-5]